MKKSIFFTLAACFVMMLTSCSKEIELEGTTWTANFSKEINYQGVGASVSMDMTLTFTDATAYKMEQHAVVTMMGQTFPQDETGTGTYTFDGEKGVFDGEQAFTYDKDAETITTSIKLDDESAEIFGTNSLDLVFKQKK